VNFPHQTYSARDDPGEDAHIASVTLASLSPRKAQSHRIDVWDVKFAKRKKTNTLVTEVTSN
jgi:hypothetical protein